MASTGRDVFIGVFANWLFLKVGRPAKGGLFVVVVKARKPLSAEANARIAAAQKNRWAKARKAVSVKKAVSVAIKKAPAKKAANVPPPPLPLGRLEGEHGAPTEQVCCFPVSLCVR